MEALRQFSARQKGGATWKQIVTRHGGAGGHATASAGDLRGLSGGDPAVEHAEQRRSWPEPPPDSPRARLLDKETMTPRWPFLPAPRGRLQPPVHHAGTSVPGGPGARAKRKSAVGPRGTPHFTPLRSSSLLGPRVLCPCPLGQGVLTRHAQWPRHCDSGLPSRSHPAHRSSPAGCHSGPYVLPHAGHSPGRVPNVLLPVFGDSCPERACP